MASNLYLKEAEKKHVGTVFHVFIVILVAQFFYIHELGEPEVVFFIAWSVVFCGFCFIFKANGLTFFYIKFFLMFAANSILAYFSGKVVFLFNFFAILFFFVGLILALRNIFIIFRKPPRMRYMPVSTILLGDDIKSFFGYLLGVVCIALPTFLCFSGLLSISQVVRLLALFLSLVTAVQFLTFLIVYIARVKE